jgi:hypothetical protein
MLIRGLQLFVAAVLSGSAFTAVASAPGVVDLNGVPVDPLTVKGGTRAHVLVFTTTDCPIANRYAPEVSRLAAAYASRGVRFWIVYPVAGDTAEKIRAHVTRFGLDLPVARDTAAALVKWTGVRVTPEVAVVDARGEMVYRGRVDDRYVDFGIDRPAPTTRDLDQALEQLLAGRPVEPSTTQAVGCILSDLLK